MRCLVAFFVITLAAMIPAYAEDCPPEPDYSQELLELRAGLKSAPDEKTARRFNDAIWQIWRTAPDRKAQALLDRADELRRSYAYLEAEAVLDELVAYCPDYAEGYNQRAFVKFLREYHRDSLVDLEEVLMRRPNHFGALSGKAMVLMRMGAIEEGQSVLRQALAIHPWLAERALLIPPKEKGQSL